MSTPTDFASQLEWHCQNFEQLEKIDLYKLLKLRTDIFVVEQNCAYPELDLHDCHPQTQHLFAVYQGEIVAYSRLLPAKLTYSTPSIGRILVAQKMRKHGLGKQLMTKALAQMALFWQNQTITIGAQYHLLEFYQQLGFIEIAKPYLEDGIKHIDMQYSI